MNREIDSGERPAPTQELTRPVVEHVPEPPPSREHELIRMGGYSYRLSPAELDAMGDIGRFRTVTVRDLARFRYQGKASSMQQDLRTLREQGLVQMRTVWNGPKSQKLTVAVLTRLGKEMLGRQGSHESGQAFYAGFVKPAEVRHDAAIYRMYQAEKEKIERSGGQIRRVVLDYELKQKIYSPLAKAKALAPPAYAKRQAEVAHQNGLTVIQGKIPLPDLRIEYRTASGELSSIDLELTTGHYHGPALQTKAEAGFKMYAASDSASKLTRVLEERDIIATILSL